MWTVTLCLLPAAGWGVYLFGPDAFMVLAASVLSAVITEALAARLAGRATLRDGSAVLTGLLLGMTMPPAVPLFVPVVAAAFAMLVVKWSFGGLGTNWMNPVLAGRVFAAFSWPVSMANWVVPRTFAEADGVAAATPLGIIRTAEAGTRVGPIVFLQDAGYPLSGIDLGATSWINARLLAPLGIYIPPGYVDLFVGNTAGSIGEGSALLLLVGTVVLFARRIITWHIPAAFFLTFALCTWVFGGLYAGMGLFAGDVLFAVFTGGFILAAFYMATDPVTSPLTGAGMLLYGAGAGLLTFVLRAYGRFPESIASAIIVMNILVPLIDRAIRPRRFGIGRRIRGVVPQEDARVS